MMPRVRHAWTALLLVGCVLWTLPALALNSGLAPPASPMDRQSPHAAAQGFLSAAHRGDYATAAHYLDLDFIPRAQQPERGAQLARRLKFVLDRKLAIDLASVSKAPEGDPADARFDQLGVIPLEGANVSIRLQRVTQDSALVWVFSESTVRMVDSLFEAYGPRVAEWMPPFFFSGTVLGLEPWQWLGLLVTLLGALGLSLLLERVTLAIALRVARWTDATLDDQLVEAGRGPLRLPFFAALLVVGTSFLLLPRPVQTVANRVSYSLLIVSVAWFILRFLRVFAAFVQSRVSSETQDAARARSLRTQFAVLRAVFEAATYVVAAALLLMQFEVVRNVGVSLLASAGIAGLVIGLAAQKSISTLLAGIQLSITQPIRIGDQVVVETEFGTVEEITLTYVVLRVWDQRRMVIPITYFLDKPFQNWSKVSPELLGAVTLQVDYSTDVDAMRAELKRILSGEAQHLWDGRFQSVVVLEAQDRTLTIRALVSAANPDKLFDLRALVRERLVSFLRAHPQWLPFTRTESRQAPTPLPEPRDDPQPDAPQDAPPPGPRMS
ncbi:mechanosensitive ion channel family protein [Myxococcus stipitatus DSM 14675]|uniref:Mechanosensitive ion channel family protein n=1 Tax=Myxococcus stipitatus (strain DSM 14675 / JCM 12634 / Mx s8) TaxID=1278073 RepID=L7UHQ6_MYXSD|nr:mechanosensitive ion channel family protein [Myxococcus stipitatus]AGC47553.1 mechanosensitive ion channel family protein [Myxococcus stipitatus DSM 14675]